MSDKHPHSVPEEILAGETEVEVTNGLTGSKHTLKVKLLSIREYDKYLRLQAEDDEVGMVVLFSGQPPEFIEGLTPQSFERALDAGERLNEVPFGRYLERVKKRRRALFPEQEEIAARAAAEFARASAERDRGNGPSSSPAPPSLVTAPLRR